MNVFAVAIHQALNARGAELGSESIGTIEDAILELTPYGDVLDDGIMMQYSIVRAILDPRRWDDLGPETRKLLTQAAEPWMVRWAEAAAQS